jgi:spore maturation protein B
VKILEKLPIFQLEKLPVPQQSMARPDDAAGSPNDQSLLDESALIQPARVPMPIWGTLSLSVLGVFFAVLFIRIMAPNVFGLEMPADSPPNGFVRAVNALSILAIPFLLSFFPLYAAARGVKVYDEFVEGAKEAFNVILKIIPFLLKGLLTPLLAPLHFPPDLVPLALMRPLSGSGTLALLTDIIHRLGPDNIVSLMAATVYGSTETTFYVAAVYFGSVGIKRTRHAILAGLLADLTGVIASVVICRAVL